MLARTKFMLNDLEDNLYSQGLYYENKFKTNREQDLYTAINDWENLRKGVDINYTTKLEGYHLTCQKNILKKKN